MIENNDVQDALSGLKVIKASLAASFDHVWIKGQGLSSFVFAMHASRSVEISSDWGRWWVEFWGPDEDEYATPVDEAFAFDTGSTLDT